VALPLDICVTNGKLKYTVSWCWIITTFLHLHWCFYPKQPFSRYTF